MQQINVSDFTAVCLQLLEQVRRTGEPIEIVKDGQPLAVVQPPAPVRSASGFGALKATLRGPVGDLVTPLDGE